MLSAVEQKRLQVSRGTEAEKKSQFGQFFTPQRTAAFMVNLFPDSTGRCILLDAGAGIGSLSAAFLDRWESGGFHFSQVDLDAFEIDRTLHPHLEQVLEKYQLRKDFTATIRGEDFIQRAVDSLSGYMFSERLPQYTHAILNPPYKKINSDSAYRLALRKVGIETVNLYSAFLALAVALTAPGGQIVAIVPRSFCNGPYYRPFRAFLLECTAIRHIHLFASRDQAFKDDEVLQENIILRLERSGQQQPVIVSTSTDDTFSDLASHEHPFGQIVPPNDPEQIIHIPTSTRANLLELSTALRFTLDQLGIQVSTGPVVDFRQKEHLRKMPGPGTVPLLYPCHFSGSGISWPVESAKKPNAILRNAVTEKWLYPNGFYCVVRRFSSKEEKRRIVASVVDPGLFGEAPVIGFENHINLFHQDKRSLPKALAYGLAVYLNSTVVDEYFRRFSGHTQVNAADLKLIKYPSLLMLTELGEWALQQDRLTQASIDHMVGALGT